MSLPEGAKAETGPLRGCRPPAVFHASIEPGGVSFSAPADTPLLLAAQQAGIDLESSCRNGTCRTCICSLDSGTITYRIDWPGLSAEEKEEGYILPCVAYPLSDVVLRISAV